MIFFYELSSISDVTDTFDFGSSIFFQRFTKVGAVTVVLFMP
jgi:hypothetical protein